MEEKEVVENNKLIAKFMGAKIEGTGRNQYIMSFLLGSPYDSFTDDSYSVHKLKFHFSWDWLMPVVEKIGKLKMPDDTYESGIRVYAEYIYPFTFGQRSKEGKYMFRFYCSQLFEADTLIESVYLGVVNFIKLL